MTWTLFLNLTIPFLFVGFLLVVIGAMMPSISMASTITGVTGLVFFLFGFIVCMVSPSKSVMYENEYNRILNIRPTCVKNVTDNDFTKISLDCAEEYIEYRTDSLNIAKKYFEYKEETMKKLQEGK
jgi:diphthamide biosynthesis methyltransferase